MRIALVNGSPKFKDSASEILLNIACEYLEDVETERFICNKMQLEMEDMERILNSDAILFAFPLYIDSIPSHLLRCLVQIQKYIEVKTPAKKPMIYTIVNNGFIDGKQNRFAIENMAHWSHRCGFAFGQGVGVGGGGMAPNFASIPGEHGPKKNIAVAFHTLCDNMKLGKSGETLSVEPNFPKIAYKIAAEYGWRMLAKKNGLRAKDLSMQR